MGLSKAFLWVAYLLTWIIEKHLEAKLKYLGLFNRGGSSTKMEECVAHIRQVNQCAYVAAQSSDAWAMPTA